MLSSRERILRCIRHQEIDRVPVVLSGLVGWNDRAWENREPSYMRLMASAREHTDCIYFFDPPMRQAQRKRQTVESANDIDAFLSAEYEAPVFDMNEFARHQALLGDKGVMCLTIKDAVFRSVELTGTERFAALCEWETSAMRRLLAALHDRAMAELRAMLAGGARDVMVRILGAQYAAVLPQPLFEELEAEPLRLLCREVTRAGGLPLISCPGPIAHALDAFADAGAAALAPVEPPPMGDVTLAEAKQRLGGKLCLMGGIPLSELETAEPGRIDELVRAAMDAAKEGSGFIISPTALPSGAPLEISTERNLFQLIRSALKYGRY